MPEISLERNPALLSTLMGAYGGVFGVACGVCLMCGLGTALANAPAFWPGGVVPSNWGEAFGYPLAIDCIIMFPVGGAVLGAMGGLVAGLMRKWTGRRFSQLMPLAAGSVLTLVFTIALGTWFVLADRPNYPGALAEADSRLALVYGPWAKL